MLKANEYQCKHWLWLLDGLKTRVDHWYNKWISHARRVILIKGVLESISVYWVTLVFIIVLMLKKFESLCFHYLWSWKENSHNILLVKWELITRSNLERGWGLKDIKKKSRSLTTKGIWKLIAKRGLWRQLCYRKYIFPMKFYEWIWSSLQRFIDGSLFWKVNM